MAGQPTLPRQAHLWSSPHRCLLGELSCPLLPKVRLPTGAQLIGVEGMGKGDKMRRTKRGDGGRSFFPRLFSGVVCCHQVSLCAVAPAQEAVPSTWNAMPAHHLTPISQLSEPHLPGEAVSSSVLCGVVSGVLSPGSSHHGHTYQDGVMSQLHVHYF